MLHILDRFVIHFFSSCGMVLSVVFALSLLIRHRKLDWLPTKKNQILVLSAVLVFAFSTLREAWDVDAGQTLTKAGFDYASWLLGAGVSVWGLMRWNRMPE